MITLISGGPGSGKTAYAVDQILSEVESSGRPVFCLGIDDLKIQHYPVPPISEWTRMIYKEDDPSISHPMFTFPDGSLIVLDEAQDVFKPRSSAAAVPTYVSALDRHRHLGLDFILITQFPTHIDFHVRNLVTKHIHVEARWAGGKLYEWAKTHDPNSRMDRGLAATRRYSPPKRVFELYKSASLHIKQSRRLPTAVYVFFVAILIAGYFGNQIYQRIYSMSGQQKKIPVTQPPANSSPKDQSAISQLVSNQQQTTSLKSTETPFTSDQLIPRINTRPESAPLYDSIRTPKSLPTIVGCVDSSRTCRCFTSQATDAFLNDRQCREWLRRRPFDPFKSPPSIDNNSAVRAIASVDTPANADIKRSSNDLEQIMQAARK